MDLETRVREHFHTAYGLTDQAADRLVLTCRSSLSEAVTNLEHAISSGDTGMIVHWAHTLKGNLLSAGLADLAETARGIETGATAGLSSQALSDFRSLHDILGNFLKNEAPSSNGAKAI